MQHPASGVTWDALDEATGLTAVSTHERPFYQHNARKLLTQLLGHLQNSTLTDDISADRNKPMRSGLPPDRLMMAYLDNLQLIERAA